MKVGDLVKLLSSSPGASFRAGIIVEFIEKKCWRTEKLGVKIDWGKIDPEPHAVVRIKGANLSFPVVDLEVISASR